MYQNSDLIISPSSKLKIKSLNQTVPVQGSDQTSLVIYDTRIWGPANASNIHPIQAFKTISLLVPTGAQWYNITQRSTNYDS